MKILATHNGTFHADEVIATAILTTIYKDYKIIRTRNLDELEKADLVYDVGAKYDGVKYFDYHQKTFNENFVFKLSGSSKTKQGEFEKLLSEKIKLTNFTTRQSSAGLIFKHFYGELLKSLEFDLEDLKYDFLKEKFINDVYAEYFEGVDAIDNGDDRIASIVKVRNFSDIIKSFDTHKIDNNEDFMKAVEFAKYDLQNYLRNKFESFRTGYLITIDVLYKFIESNSDLEYIISESEMINRYFLSELVNLLGLNVNFLIFYSTYTKGFKIFGLPKNRNSFECRKYLKKEWRGIRGEGLVNLSGIKGCVFVHYNGFTGENETLEGAIEMTVQSLIQ